jgi:hypothetical protein
MTTAEGLALVTYMMQIWICIDEDLHLLQWKPALHAYCWRNTLWNGHPARPLQASLGESTDCVGAVWTVQNGNNNHMAA